MLKGGRKFTDGSWTCICGADWGSKIEICRCGVERAEIGVPGMPTVINHPLHHNSHPTGIECIEIVEHFNFNVGNAIKCLWRAGLKEGLLEDLEKAAWYVQREIERVKEDTL